MDKDTWKPITSAPEGLTVFTKIDDAQGPRNPAKLKRQGRLWWFPDMSMYVYYAPTHWRELEQSELTDEDMLNDLPNSRLDLQNRYRQLVAKKVRAGNED